MLFCLSPNKVAANVPSHSCGSGQQEAQLVATKAALAQIQRQNLLRHQHEIIEFQSYVRISLSFDVPDAGSRCRRNTARNEYLCATAHFFEAELSAQPHNLTYCSP